uniref:Uncharacterized protein n=1 Tax=Salix viminalis TaxID=40686 RepID=A0A6N2L906_SALVM
MQWTTPPQFVWVNFCSLFSYQPPQRKDIKWKPLSSILFVFPHWVLRRKFSAAVKTNTNKNCFCVERDLSSAR